LLRHCENFICINWDKNEDTDIKAAWSISSIVITLAFIDVVCATEQWRYIYNCWLVKLTLLHWSAVVGVCTKVVMHWWTWESRTKVGCAGNVLYITSLTNCELVHGRQACLAVCLFCSLVTLLMTLCCHLFVSKGDDQPTSLLPPTLSITCHFVPQLGIFIQYSEMKWKSQSLLYNAAKKSIILISLMLTIIQS